MIHDISPPITPDLAVWPGDTPPSREVLQDMCRGDEVTVSTLHATAHLGAHVDAPSHYDADAPTIDESDLDLFIGPCQVVRVNVARGERVGVEHIQTRITAERVLIATGTYPDPTSFNEDFAGIAPELVDGLHERGVRLVGVDTPSVDAPGAMELPAHKRFLALGMTILEGLVLSGVDEGTYELIALPLRLVGFDASPVRAVLREIQKSV